MSFELFALFGTSFVVGLSGALMPGPLVTLAIAESARSGFGRGPTVVLGHAVVEVLTVAGLLLGVSELVQHAGVAGAIGVIGGGVLLWMGYGMARGAWRGEVSLRLDEPGPAVALEGAPAPPGRLQALAARCVASPAFRGGLVSISNPYWLLWWATVGAAYVGRSLTLGLAGLLAFYLGHVLSDLGWISLVSAAVASGRRALSERVYRGLILGCAVALVGLGAYFLWSGVPALLGAIGL